MVICFTWITVALSPLPEVTLLSVYLRLCWVFVAAQAVSSCGEQGLLSLWRAGAPLVAACGLTAVASLVAELGFGALELQQLRSACS